MDISGKIVQLLPLQSGQGKNGPWKKQDFVLETGDQYPKKVCISLWGDKVDQFKPTEGEQVTVSFDVESREYNGRWYTDVKAWKITRQGDGAGITPDSPNMPSYIDTPPPDSGDDLPF